MNENNMYGGGWVWVILILLIAFGGNGFGNNNNAAMLAGYATQADINNALNAQTNLLNNQQLLLSSANNNYETARLIDNQTMQMMNQNNTNLLTAVNGFNAVTNTITAGFNTVNQNLAALSHQMENCCCSIQRQMLQDKYDNTRDQLINAQNVAVNSNQSQYLLSQLGKWVPYTSGGSAISGS